MPDPNRPYPGSHGLGSTLKTLGRNFDPCDIGKLVGGSMDDINKTMNQPFGSGIGGGGWNKNRNEWDDGEDG